MLRKIILGLVLLCGATWAMAERVDVATAKQVGAFHLQKKGLIKNSDTLLLAHTYYNTIQGATQPTMYVFNIGNEGFVIVSADNCCTPVMGYSMNGGFAQNLLPVNMKDWLEQCSMEIAQGLAANPKQSDVARRQWAEALDANFTIPSAPKSESYLVQSTWEQGYGYNKYCPVMNGQPVVVGCVATAMAQIIRYWEYPRRGFGQKSYVHGTYGTQAVDFDTTDYDYTLMPMHVSYWTGEAEIDMVSRLCYHCGVVVNMEYENPGHPDGSGAHTKKVQEGIMHFGYTDAEHYVRLNINDDARWIQMIHNEIDNLRPIEYSGFGFSGGHAFVLDGYNNSNEFHFNWGWGGYGDGFYTLTTMQGFVNTHEMVINIYPSGWDGHAERFLVSPDGHGDGTSWENANSNIDAAVALNAITHRDIWLKEGVYYGNNASDDYAFYWPNKTMNITGGFAGTETAVNQRNANLHPTIFDAQGQRGVLFATNGSGRQMKLSDIVLQNGHTNQSSAVSLQGNINTNFFTIRNCVSDSGNVVRIADCRMRMAKIYGNTGVNIIQLDDAILRQSLVCNNDATGAVVDMGSGDARLVNNDIVANNGLAVWFRGAKNSFVNNIVWNNDTTCRIDVTLGDTCMHHNALECDTLLADSTSIVLTADNADVRFVNPGQRGVAGLNDADDWHLGRGSVCIDGGIRIAESITDGDLDRQPRCRNNIIDMGCYETNYPVGIAEVESAGFSIYPNPATHLIAIQGEEVRDAAIFDINGRAVMQVSGSTADVSSLPAGVYYLRCQGRAAKFIKQ